MSSSGNCSCGSSCSCDSCNCKYPNISETAAMGTGSIITGLAPQVNMNSYGRAEMGFAAEGCKCGSSCTCDPCNC